MSGKRTLVIEATLTNLEEVRQFVESSARSFLVDERVISDLRLAVDEAVTNTIIHGYKHKQGTIEISIERDAAALIVNLRDRAPEFNPSSYSASNLPASPERKTPGGFGIRLIKEVMDEVNYQALSNGGNELTLIKHNTITVR